VEPAEYRFAVKKKTEFEQMFGKKLADEIIKEVRKSGGRRLLPSSVIVCNTKPAFYLNDGDTLRAYRLDLINQKIIGEHWCGSGDTTINHKEQMAEGEFPDSETILFVREMWNGSTMSWYLTVVTKNFEYTVTPEGTSMKLMGSGKFIGLPTNAPMV
jgi:hypothetical protein